MKRKQPRGITRRTFTKLAGGGALAAGVGGPAFLFPERAEAQQKTLKIIQWSHFVPAWDTWFNGTYTKEWGQKNNTNVIVDNINLVDLPARAASEVSAKKGHDLFMFLSPPASYEQQVIDMTNVYQEVEKKHGKKIDLAHKSTYNPKTKKYFAFSDAYTPDPGNWHKDWWTEAGISERAGHLRRPAQGRQEDPGQERPPVRDRPLAGARHQHGLARPALVVRRGRAGRGRQRHDQLEADHRSPEVHEGALPADGDGRGLHLDSSLEQPGDARRPGLATSRTRSPSRASRRREKLPIDSKIMISPALKGPVRRIAAEHVMNCHVIWEFAENKEGAQKFLIDFMDHFHEGFVAGQFYNFPCFPSTVPDLQKLIANDPRANPPDKYKVLGNVLDWATNVGYPGYATAGISEAFSTWVIPTMFASVARGDQSAEDAAKAAEAEYKRIFARWK